MRVFYLVLAHRGPRQLAALLAALDAPWTRTLVHVDATSDRRTLLGPHLPRGARALESSRDVTWGGWSVVAATLDLLASAAPDLRPDDYVVLLSGDAYPLASQEVVLQVLGATAGDEHIRGFPMPDHRFAAPVERLSRYHLESDPRSGPAPLRVRAVNRLGIRRDWRRALAPLVPHSGSQWWAVTGAAALWLLAEHHRDPRRARFFHHSLVPDEVYLQTIAAAAPWAGRIRHNLVWADFSRPQGPYPAVLDDDHVAALLASPDMSLPQDHFDRGPVLFARKTPGQPTGADGPGGDDLTDAIRRRVWPHWARLARDGRVAGAGMHR